VKILERLFALLGSYGLACLLLLNLFLLTWFGTLHQVEKGLYEAQRLYFESWFVVESYPVPHALPGGVLCMGLLAVNLFVGGLVRIQKKKRTIGVLIVHVGIALLLASGFVKLYHSDDGVLRLYEGESSDEYVDPRRWEVAVWDTSQTGPVEEHLIGNDQLVELVDGRKRTFTSPELPFDLELSKFLPNCEPMPKGPMWTADSLVVGGYAFKAQPYNPEDDGPPNIAGLSAVFRSRDGSTTQEDLLWGFEYHPATFEAGGKTWGVSLRRTRYSMPYRIRLEDFRKVDHPGMTLARSFESDITRIDGSGERKVRIQMNEPLREGGLVLFQSSYGPQGNERDPRQYSVFSVVRNPSDHWPLYACIVIAIGLALALIPKLLKFVRAQNEARAKPQVST
jgi:hypothetical protein